MLRKTTIVAAVVLTLTSLATSSVALAKDKQVKVAKPKSIFTIVTAKTIRPKKPDFE